MTPILGGETLVDSIPLTGRIVFHVVLPRLRAQLVERLQKDAADRGVTGWVWLVWLDVINPPKIRPLARMTKLVHKPGRAASVLSVVTSTLHR